MKFKVFGTLAVVVGIGILALSGCDSDAGRAGYAYVESQPEAIESADAAHATPSATPGRRGAKSPDGEEWLTRFELIERSGEMVSSDDLRGQPYIVGFFFSKCPSICVNQNGKVRELQEKYRGRPLRLLSITCDPETDRPEVLAEYAERFDADPEQWLFLTGKLDYIRRVGAEMYMLPVEKRFHAEKFVLVDGQGERVGFYTWSDPASFAALQRDIDRLLDPNGTPPK